MKGVPKNYHWAPDISHGCDLTVFQPSAASISQALHAASFARLQLEEKIRISRHGPHIPGNEHFQGIDIRAQGLHCRDNLVAVAFSLLDGIRGLLRLRDRCFKLCQGSYRKTRAERRVSSEDLPGPEPKPIRT